MVVDVDLDEFRADAVVLAAPDPGDAVAGLVETGKLLDVEMDQIAGLAVVAMKVVHPERAGRLVVARHQRRSRSPG